MNWNKLKLWGGSQLPLSFLKPIFLTSLPTLSQSSLPSSLLPRKLQGGISITQNIICFPRPYPGVKLVRDKSPIAWGHIVVLTSSWYELPKYQWCGRLSVPIQSECVSHPQQTSKANIMPTTLGQDLTQQSNILCPQDSIESISWREIKYAGRKAGFLSFQPSTTPLRKVVIFREATLMGLHLRLAAFSLTLGEQWQPRYSGQGGGEEAGAAKGGKLF